MFFINFFSFHNFLNHKIVNIFFSFVMLIKREVLFFLGFNKKIFILDVCHVLNTKIFS